jgi:hypothetical protein
VQTAFGARYLHPAIEVALDRLQQHGTPLGVARPRSPQMPFEVAVVHEFGKRKLRVRGHATQSRKIIMWTDPRQPDPLTNGTARGRRSTIVRNRQRI